MKVALHWTWKVLALERVCFAKKIPLKLCAKVVCWTSHVSSKPRSCELSTRHDLSSMCFLSVLLRLSLCLQDIVYILDSARRSACTCGIFSLHGRCEHSLFVDSLDLPHRKPRVDLGRLPTVSRRPGRKRRSAESTPRAQRRELRAQKRAKRWPRGAPLLLVVLHMLLHPCDFSFPPADSRLQVNAQRDAQLQSSYHVVHSTSVQRFVLCLPVSLANNSSLVWFVSQMLSCLFVATCRAVSFFNLLRLLTCLLLFLPGCLPPCLPSCAPACRLPCLLLVCLMNTWCSENLPWMYVSPLCTPRPPLSSLYIVHVTILCFLPSVMYATYAMYVILRLWSWKLLLQNICHDSCYGRGCRFCLCCCCFCSCFCFCGVSLLVFLFLLLFLLLFDSF